MRNTIYLATAALVLAGCGGGGSGDNGTGGSAAPGASGGESGADSGGQASAGPVEGLVLPSNLSVLSAKEDGGEPVSSALSGLHSKLDSTTMALGDFDAPETDYSTDPAHTYVYDESMEGLNIINEILCYMEQTAASAMVNRGAYDALINEERCRQGENRSSSGETGQSSSETADFVRWTLESTRADNESPQIVRLWVPGEQSAEGDEGPGREQILVEMTVTEGVSDSLPFGRFSMNFKGVVDGAPLGMPGSEVEMMNGSLATVDNPEGAPQFRFINIGGDALNTGHDFGFGFEEAANVRLDDANGTSGLGRTYRGETWSFEGPFGPEQGESEQSFAVAYDASRFLSSRDENGDASGDMQVCRSRDEFDLTVWRYNLYHEDDGQFRGRDVVAGERVTLNSGFPFTFDADGDGSSDSQGWIGYHGVWTESDQALEDGQSIFQYDYDDDTSIEHTLSLSPGRLIRRTADQELLSAFVGDEFQYWGEHPAHDVFGQWIVTVGENLDFAITRAFEWGDNGPEYFETIDHDGNPETPEVDVEAAVALNDYDTLWLWSEALGGNVVYTHEPSVASLDREVTFYGEEFVAADDDVLFAAGASQTLQCYEQCLKGGLTQEDVDQAVSQEDLFHPYAGQPMTYTLQAESGKVILIDDSNGLPVDATELSMDSLGFDWGIQTGEMLTELIADPNQPWLVYEQPVSYRWETGPNPWNVTVSVLDGTGGTLVFDRPLEFAYMHTLDNDANADARFVGKRFQLQYSGPGDLHGFPWEREGESHRWYPLVTLADGTMLENADGRFLVRGLEKEQAMRSVDPSQCAGLDADAVYADPSLDLADAGDIGTVTMRWADRPIVDGPPSVIEGAIQE